MIKIGSIVLKKANAGFVGQESRCLIPDNDENYDSYPCMVCDKPNCNEWPTLFEINDKDELTGHMAYHVSDCQLTFLYQKFTVNPKSRLEIIVGHLIREMDRAIDDFQSKNKGGQQVGPYNGDFRIQVPSQLSAYKRWSHVLKETLNPPEKKDTENGITFHVHEDAVTHDLLYFTAKTCDVSYCPHRDK